MTWTDRHYCGTVTASLIGEDVNLYGWVDAIRDHGNLLFIHLRDTSGIVQVVFNQSYDIDVFNLSTSLRPEDVINIKGIVAKRSEDTINNNLITGKIEIAANFLNVLAKSEPLPFPISEKSMVFGENLETGSENVDEELRLQFRYLDMRRPSVQYFFKKRHEIIKIVRDLLSENNFIEVETPFLTKSTPEGARDYLVPSRIHHGKFYALPQSPQLFKQLLMIGGMDRYFQIARCFRDEDLRPNRQPEFTQLDMEASFIDEEFIYNIIEKLIVLIFEAGGIKLVPPFKRMSYYDAMDRFGTDRPDLRFGMEFVDVTDVVRTSNYSIFRKIIEQGGRVKGFCVSGKSDELSKNVLQNEYAFKIAPSFGAKGMTWMRVMNGELESNIVKFFDDKERDGLRESFNAVDGDVLIMVADVSIDDINKVLCSLRLHIANRLNMIPKSAFCPVWITDFPMFEMKDSGVQALHHPFTMPNRVDFNPDDIDELLSLSSRAYDLVMNGEELGGGSIRIHRMEIQEKIFKALGLKNEEIESKFGFFLKALRFGAPPHGGLALGMDRVIAMILGTDSIRDVIAFPKNRSALCPLTQAPSFVDMQQLRELGLTEGLKSGVHKIEAPVYKNESYFDNIDKDGIDVSVLNYVATLGSLRLNKNEENAFIKDLNEILVYVKMIQDLDTENVSPLAHIVHMENVWRSDELKKSGQEDSILACAPERENNYFKVPRVIEG